MGGNRGKWGKTGGKTGGNGGKTGGKRGAMGRGVGGYGLGWCVMILIDVRTRWPKEVSLWQKKKVDPPLLVHGPR